ncbi:Protein C07D8.6 [Aphelenchoides avenae]|nr:Protein C07D8.6 [Aphelenchus avenae]
MSKLSEQLIRLKLDYVDLYLMHFPAAMKPDGTMDTTVKPEDTWKEMEKLYKEGKARAIGVSNFNASQIHRILKIAKTPPHVLQVETHVHFVQKDLQKLCDENNITMEAYAPLGAPGRPPYLLPKGHPYPWPPGPKPLLNPQVLKLAGKYGKPPASILLRYLIQRGLVAIPKSVSPERIYENIQVFDFKLTDKEMEKLSNQTPQKRVYPQEWQVPCIPCLFLSEFLYRIKGHPEDPFAGER